MAYGAVDLRTGVAADAFVAAFERELAREKDRQAPGRGLDRRPR
jgi:hypothetical protein